MNAIKPNIGTFDRYLRLSAGLLLFGSGITGRRSSLSRYALTTIGAAKIAEGITGWCPLIALTGGGSINNDSNTQQSTTARAGETQPGTTTSLHQSGRDHSEAESRSSAAKQENSFTRTTTNEREADSTRAAGSDVDRKDQTTAEEHTDEDS